MNWSQKKKPLFAVFSWKDTFKRMFLHQRWAFAHSSRLRTLATSRPWLVQQTRRWAFLRWFLTVCAEILVQTNCCIFRLFSLAQSCRWTNRMWWFCASVVIRGLQWWGQMDVLPNSLKWRWRWLMVVKWTFNSWATALVDIPCGLHASCTLPQSLQHLWYFVVWLKMHTLEGSYYDQPKTHLCNNHVSQHLDMLRLSSGWNFSSGVTSQWCNRTNPLLCDLSVLCHTIMLHYLGINTQNYFNVLHLLSASVLSYLLVLSHTHLHARKGPQ